VANIMETQVKHEVEDSIDTSSTTPNTSHTELEINCNLLKANKK
jgi:hypothetical protein